LDEVSENIGGRLLDDLIYSFLLQSGYPRASIVFNVDLLNPLSQMGRSIKIPSFIIVDPESAQPLAVIEVVDAIDGEELKQAAIETGAYASRLANKLIQGFLIRVDVRGRTEAEQVRFYRIWPNSTLQRLSSKNFPDLETLRVSRKLIENSSVTAVSQTLKLPAETETAVEDRDISHISPGAGMYLPAIILLVLMVVDGMLLSLRGSPLLSVPQSVLAFGAAVLLTLPAAIRYLRRRE
jgi:hypothetical protein